MLLHILSLMSIPAYLCGISYFAVLLSCLEVKRLPRCTIAIGRITDTNPHHFANLTGIGCILASSLFLPVGSLPAYIETSAAMNYWFALFSVACGAFFYLTPTLSIRSVLTLLATPVILAVVFAVCATYAYRHGFPGNLWNMESYVALPIVTGATPQQLLGILCMGVAAVLHCASALAPGKDTFFLRACLRLGAAQFLFCLFFPILPSRFIDISPALAVILDYTLYWVFIAVLVVRIFPLAAQYRLLCRFSPVLAIAGAALCLM